MDNKNKATITLLVSDKPGVLSSLMLKSGSLGLRYRRLKSEKLSNGNTRIAISFDGKLNCDRQQSIDVFKEHPAVIKVEKIVVSDF